MKINISKVKVVKKEPHKVRISTPYIKLDAVLKLSNVISTGGQAKMIIQDELVKVNGEVCTIRGKKLVIGDTFEFEKRLYEVV
ncbi:MAG: RNA-binding S4 domain-containing protein [Clostridia bacterium]